MNSMPNLTASDQQRVQAIARQAAQWFELFQSITAPESKRPRLPNIDDRLDIILNLHHLPEFQNYVKPFIKDDDRINAFEDAVAEAIYTAALNQHTSI